MIGSTKLELDGFMYDTDLATPIAVIHNGYPAYSPYRITRVLCKQEDRYFIVLSGGNYTPYALFDELCPVTDERADEFKWGYGAYDQQTVLLLGTAVEIA